MSQAESSADGVVGAEFRSERRVTWSVQKAFGVVVHSKETRWQRYANMLSNPYQAETDRSMIGFKRSLFSPFFQKCSSVDALK